jgi:hypothetical protein
MLRDSDSSHLIQVNRMRIAYEPKRLEGQDIDGLTDACAVNMQ